VNGAHGDAEAGGDLFGRTRGPPGQPAPFTGALDLWIDVVAAGGEGAELAAIRGAAAAAQRAMSAGAHFAAFWDARSAFA
jgi:hypothetical protein